MCIYIYICIHTYIHTYIHTGIHTHTHIHTYTHTHIHTYTFCEVCGQRSSRSDEVYGAKVQRSGRGPSEEDAERCDEEEGAMSHGPIHVADVKLCRIEDTNVEDAQRVEGKQKTERQSPQKRK